MIEPNANTAGGRTQKELAINRYIARLLQASIDRVEANIERNIARKQEGNRRAARVIR